MILMNTRFFISVLLLTGTLAASAAEPHPFELGYKVKYGGLNAESVRKLIALPQGGYHMEAETDMRILGVSVSTIRESADFGWQDELPVPLAYSYEQTGLGSRSRNLVFDMDAGNVQFMVDEESGSLPLELPLYDDLSSFLVLRQQLATGNEDITFEVVDRNEVKDYHYRIIDREALDTELGTFSAVHLERIRDVDSERTTEFWLADQHDYILLKLLQVEPGGREILLELNSAVLDGELLRPEL